MTATEQCTRCAGAHALSACHWPPTGENMTDQEIIESQKLMIDGLQKSVGALHFELGRRDAKAFSDAAIQPSDECPACDGTGINSDEVSCDECDGQGRIIVSKPDMAQPAQPVAAPDGYHMTGAMIQSAMAGASYDVNKSSLMRQWPIRGRENLLAAPAAPASAPVEAVDPALWIVHHDGKSAQGHTIMDMMRGAQGLRTEAEQLVAAQRLMVAIDADLAEEAETPSALPHPHAIYAEVVRLAGEYAPRVNPDGVADVLEAIRALQGKPEADKPSDCNGNPSCCPDNEGRGCYCTDNGIVQGKPEAPKGGDA